MLPVIRIGELVFATFPLIILLAMFSCAICYMKSKFYQVVCPMEFLHSAWVPMIFTLFGGKLVYVFSQSPQTLAEWIHHFVYSGFVFYGGLLGGFVGLYICCKKNSLSLLEYTDQICSILPLGQAIGRLGCFLNGCCYGVAYSGILSIRYPVNGKMIFVFPTWFIESAFTFSLFLYFQFACRFKCKGQRTGFYLLVYAFFRFFLEFMRGDMIRGIFYGLSTSQWISIFTIIVGAVLFASTKSNNTSVYDVEDNKI